MFMILYARYTSFINLSSKNSSVEPEKHYKSAFLFTKGNFRKEIYLRLETCEKNMRIKIE